MAGNKIISLAILCAMLTSCGLKGGLYKEDTKSERAGDFNRAEAATNRGIDGISDQAVTPR